MTTINFCKKLRVEDKTALTRYAKRLGATELIIHSDASVSMYCKDGCICERYRPTAHELYK